MTDRCSNPAVHDFRRTAIFRELSSIGTSRRAFLGSTLNFQCAHLNIQSNPSPPLLSFRTKFPWCCCEWVYCHLSSQLGIMAKKRRGSICYGLPQDSSVFSKPLAKFRCSSVRWYFPEPF